MKKGLIVSGIVITLIVSYIILFAEGKAFDPLVMHYVDTISMSNRINFRVAYTDTSGMLSNYLRASLGEKYTDTASMLSPYLRKLGRTINNAPNRVLSTTGSDNTFTINSTRDAEVHYTINFSAALTLTTSNGRVTLDYSINGGSSYVTIGSVSQVFAVSITITTNQDMELSGYIPANALVRINRTNNTNVTVTLPTTSQEEVLQ